MPSSTSNFNPPPPRHPWQKVWLGALLGAVLVLGGLEAGLRHAGHRPSIVEDKALWSAFRERVYETGDGKTPVALVGMSRIKLGFDPESIATAYPRYRFVQLAMEGAFPAATLRDLAEDERFHGIVLFETLPEGFLRMYREEQQPLVTYYHRMYEGTKGADEWVSRSVSTFLQSHFVVFNPSVSAERLWRAFLDRRGWPERLYIITRPDRHGRADFTVHDSTSHRARLAREAALPRPANLPAPEEWLAQALELEPYVERIQKRGGKVVYVRYVTTLECYAKEERDFPRAQYWDRLAARTRATTLYFSDAPALRGFECPDGAHLDYRDVPRFTRALAAELERLQVLVSGPGGMAAR